MNFYVLYFLWQYKGISFTVNSLYNYGWLYSLCVAVYQYKNMLPFSKRKYFVNPYQLERLSCYLLRVCNACLVSQTKYFPGQYFSWQNQFLVFNRKHFPTKTSDNQKGKIWLSSLMDGGFFTSISTLAPCLS